MMVKSELEQTICQECNRLICNMIVYYNSYILSQFLAQKEKLKQTEQIEALKQISPIAWRHINFYGIYYFTSSKNNNVNMEKIIELLATVTLVLEPNKIPY